MYWPYAWLGFAICAVWLPSPRLYGRPVPLWTLLFLVTLATAYSGGIIDARGLVVIVAFAAITYASVKVTFGALRVVLTALAALIMVMLPARVFPGFYQPHPNIGFTQAFGLATGGLFLLAAYVQRARSWHEVKLFARPALAIASGTVVIVLTAAWSVGYIRFDPKWPTIAPAHLAANLLFVCVAEESFFRGLLQDRLARALSRWKCGSWLAVILTSVLFGVAHLGKGPVMAALATLAGLGYGLAYARTNRIEPAVLTHFAVNGLNYLLFSNTAV